MTRKMLVIAGMAILLFETRVSAQAPDAELPPPAPTAANLPPALAPATVAVPTGFDAGFDLRYDGGAVAIGSVTPGGVADQAGLRADDRIVTIDGRNVANADEFRASASGFEGRTIEIIVERNGQPQTISLLYPRTAPIAPRAADPNRSWIGVALSRDFAERGALISRVAPSSPASRAGVRAGDVVLAINGENVVDYRDMMDRISNLIPNSSAELLVYRNGASVPVNTAIGRFEDSAGRASEAEDTAPATYETQRVPTSQDLADARMIQLGDRIYRLERMVQELQDEMRALRREQAAD
ncbi:MAG: PDZ domain-containing protein [Planctomycetia bacterium]|nr:PDZ domain-containing protein [Planctomycetia bacterium]